MRSLYLALFAFVALGYQVTGEGVPIASPIEVEGTHVNQWKEIDSLIESQQYEAAAGLVAELRAVASRDGDEETHVRALIREVQLRTALHGFEKSVALLAPYLEPAEGSPEALADAQHRALIDLFYAHSLVTYADAYSWEIRQRERVETGEELAVDRWTIDQIVTRAHVALGRVWERREGWGDRPLGSLEEFVEPGSFPDRIRGTMRDSIGYLWVELLANTSYWTPEQSNRLYRLDLAELIDSEAGVDLSPADPALHPLARTAAVLGDLELWHGASGRPEAASEARLERLRRLRDSFARVDDRLRLREAVERHLAELGDELAWWSTGMALLAELTRDENLPDSLAKAREIARKGAAAHPKSIGGQRCLHLAAAIEAADYSLDSMVSDAPGRRSLRVRHKNLDALHFRAYEVDLERRLMRSRDRELLVDRKQVEQLLATAAPAAAWSEELPPTPDYRMHTTFVTPPMTEPGLYLVASSAREDFADEVNSRSAVSILLTDLVMIRRQAPAAVEVTVRSGSTGEPLRGAEVSLWQRDYRRGHREALEKFTNHEGATEFQLADRRGNYFLIARHEGQLAVDDSYLTRREPAPLEERRDALIYTDRSIYRPGQEVFWKVVAYRGTPPRGSFSTLPTAGVQVELLDAAGQVVAQLEGTTNEFGSISGSFVIPAGRRLGGWSLRSSLGGAVSVRVEEYKRPTFEVSIVDPEAELRLNRQAVVSGEARYYFGLPVTEGSVEWRVEREPLYPRWWWRPIRRQGRETIAAGDAQLDADGRFQAEFVAEADPRDAEIPGFTYRYRLTADVTDPGGETRSASRAFRLGFVSVEASLETDESFFDVARPVSVRARRLDLNGGAAPGDGRWELWRLVQPSTTLLPADQPLPSADNGHKTPGDALRPRWDTTPSTQALLREWPDGESVAQGSVTHAEDGSATLALGELEAGVYRLRYSTEDSFGATHESHVELLIVDPGAPPLPAPAMMVVERSSVAVGETARVLVQSGLRDQELMVEIYRSGRRLDTHRLRSDDGAAVIEIPIDQALRGGFGVQLTAVRDHQLMTSSASIFVPWDDRRVKVEFESFRDLLRPGQRERWSVKLTGADGEALSRGSAELLAYMYDRSLDLFTPHRPVDPLGLYPNLIGYWQVASTLGHRGPIWTRASGFNELPGYPYLRPDRLKFFDGYPIGGPGVRRMARGGVMAMAAEPSAQAVEESAEAVEDVVFGVPEVRQEKQKAEPDVPSEPSAGDHALREDFSETAFWEPHLTLDDDGAVSFEFTVPDSLTDWNVWVHALTNDLRGGSLQTTARSAKELMVRPYLPRFLREGDRAELRVTINNAGERELSGALDFEIVDPLSGDSLRADFELAQDQALGRPFTVAGGGSATLDFPVKAPSRVGEVAFRVSAKAGDLADGELRPLPILPGRMHLVQSRFATLRDQDRRELTFDDLAADDDPSRIDQQLVVTLDAQLFYSVLGALPYLIDYPYECTEQTLNRFLSTGIVGSVFENYPAVAEMARQMAERDTRLERWDADDPNRRMSLEETPWLLAARGGDDPGRDLIRVLDPEIARAQRDASLAKLEETQTSLGGFPWWPGGPPSPYMTLYLTYGFSKALEFGVEVPKQLVVRAWSYLHRHWESELRDLMDDDCCWELVTFLNYVLSTYPDPSWTGGVFTDADRERMLDFSFENWKRHSPLLKGYLALTLMRADRADDARLVWESVMDSARTTRDEGTFWAPEERSWLWYNDTIETHALALRVLGEVSPEDERRPGLVQWLMLNKKLNHWKSTRATAEVIYSLVHYLEQEGQLGAREAATVTVGDRRQEFVWEPDSYTGKKNQIVVPGPEIDPEAMATTVVEKETPGFLFASATWHFSTERLPEEGSGDLFTVTRQLFRRLRSGGEWVLRPLAEGERLETGDQVEVHLTVRAKHAAEYVHLRDPRAAGFEPESLTSGYRWNLGIGWYEEVRDSGANFFFDRLPVGEYTLKYRIRAATSGEFKVAPATLQSMYAPEFTGYSAGEVVTVDR
jgi:uncharacterized protein YfaS (alpha-2-macroglobulin family)